MNDLNKETWIMVGLSFPAGWFERGAAGPRSSTERSWYDVKGKTVTCRVCRAKESPKGNEAFSWADSHRAWHMSRLNPSKVQAALAVMGMMATTTENKLITSEIAGMAVHQAFSLEDLAMARMWFPPNQRTLVRVGRSSSDAAGTTGRISDKIDQEQARRRSNL